jgi:hypothetical protein
MRSMSRVLAFVLIGLLLSLPVLPADDAKDDTPKKREVKKSNTKKDADKDINSEKMIKAGVARGQILEVVESDKSIRLRVPFQVPKLNPGALAAIQQAEINVARASSVQALIQAQQALAQAKARLYTMTDVSKEYELQATDDVKVRTLNPPRKFDNKGRTKKYTKKEEKELRGNDKLPGYQAEFSDLKQDQIVQVTLVKKKSAPRSPIKKSKEAAPDLLGDFLPQMSMIVIVAESKN